MTQAVAEFDDMAQEALDDDRRIAERQAERINDDRGRWE